MTNQIDTPGPMNVSSKERRPPSLKLHFDSNDVLEVTMYGDFDRLASAAANEAVANELVGQLAVLGSPGKRIDEGASNLALGFVDGMAPTDPAEVLLVAQMATLHHATMTMARRLTHSETIPQQDAAERALNKLARTYAAQMDTLKRYRSKGQQTVRVERVTVEDGGQAIVGNVGAGGRGP